MKITTILILLMLFVVQFGNANLVALSKDNNINCEPIACKSTKSELLGEKEKKKKPLTKPSQIDQTTQYLSKDKRWLNIILGVLSALFK
uniref:Uncharacterized protein n=1 Tax=Trichobilharzia regenti TaxID=157069 RepID=A0AA85JPA0_TRIRE|nr:unnamed protein product [Trichobilharzia regenti]